MPRGPSAREIAALLAALDDDDPADDRAGLPERIADTRPDDRQTARDARTVADRARRDR
ncbi:hypothetical protein LO771_07855 [Streptacidiphilus sp. ASG 303]|uniref:hypothetical protein n=1 Tax=Streptacidiphilus sp. ASG 303 TaxID=2896847 RepID=UPI001E5F04C8|nr:hypothetical protein [Streptacidiphilus sp. ASG 303]MCD0482328.1 hypothetical protein [Streptacidiphilus sp. ASG 303]